MGFGAGLPVLLLHIAAGFIALAAGLIALAAAKGGRFHVAAGRLFFWAMAATTLAAMVIAVLRPNPFLFAVALFSLYLAFAGRRAARLRPGTARWPDRLAAALMIVTALAMVGWGTGNLADGAIGLNPVLIVFGVIGGALAFQDLAAIRLGNGEGSARIVRHIGRMIGALIAAITAFTVVNGGALPELVRWLGPTVLLVPLIVYWTRRVGRVPPAIPESRLGAHR